MNSSVLYNFWVKEKFLEGNRFMYFYASNSLLWAPELNADSGMQKTDFEWGLHKGRYIYMAFGILSITLHVTCNIQCQWVKMWFGTLLRYINVVLANFRKGLHKTSYSTTGLTAFKCLLFQIHTVIMPYWAKPLYFTSNATKCAWCRFWSLFMRVLWVILKFVLIIKA